MAPDQPQKDGAANTSSTVDLNEIKKMKKQRFMGARWGQTRRPIATAAGVAVVVLVLVVVAAIMLKGTLGALGKRSTSFTLESILEDRFQPQGFNGTWVSDSEILYKDEDNNAILYNLYLLNGITLTTNIHVIPTTTGLVEYEMSYDRRFLLAIHNKTKLFGQSSLAQYEIIDLEQQKSKSLWNDDKDNEDRHLIQLAVWIPPMSGLVYVYHNDIYYRPSPVLDMELRLTQSGIPGTIYNGITDLLYRESVFKSERALWISPDGTRVAYATFNDTKVHNVSIPFYGEPSSLGHQYPHNVLLRYPKPGTPNPTVTLSVVDLHYQLQKQLSTLHVPIPKGMANAEIILSAVTWMSNEEICSVWMNRLQNTATVSVFNYDTGDRYDLLKINEDAGWLQPISAPFFSSNPKRMLIIIPHAQDVSGNQFPHVTMVQHARGRAIIKPLTTNSFSVTQILAWDELHNTIYFLGTETNYPSIQRLFSVSDDQWTAPNNPICISCEFKTTDGDMPCLYNTASFNRNHSFYMLNCAGPDIPEVTIYDRNHKKVMVWEKNFKVRKALQEVRELPKKQFLQVAVADGYMAHVELLLPPDYNPKRSTKYPMLVYVDGAPGSCLITERFSIGWNDYIAGNKSVIVAVIDGRGSGLKGSSTLFATHKKLGSVEVEDQIHVTRYLQDQFKFIDRSRTAIWGINYGGYSTGMALIKDTDNIFKCGIAVSPITEWLYSDSVTTERYMGLPTIEDNLSGYIDAGLTNKVENLRYKQFLLIHGTFDNVVHYQQSMMLAKVLQQQDILFTQQSYPDENNGLQGIQPHLYHTMEKFLDQCFKFNQL